MPQSTLWSFTGSFPGLADTKTSSLQILLRSFTFFFSTDTLSHFGSLTFLSLCLQYSGLMVLLSHKQVPSFSPRLPAVNNGCGFSQFAGVICTAFTCSDPYLPGSASRQVQEQEECVVPVVKEPSSPGSSVASL